MTDIELLKGALSHFAQLDEESFNLSRACWKIQTYKKGEIYNPVGNICRYLGFTLEGYFRAYLIGKNGEEVNLFLYPPHQVVVTYKSFIHQSPCEFTTEALTDARAICITLADLQSLYKKSHAWERFGRLMAEKAFDIAVDRAESFIFKSAEQRYLEELPNLLNTITGQWVAYSKDGCVARGDDAIGAQARLCSAI
jgi:CRP-like cAMP-binding protein